MKRIIFFIIILAHMSGFSQSQLPKLGISPAYSLSPSDTVFYGTTTFLSVYVKNYSNVAAYSGSVTVYAKIDTIGGVPCGSKVLFPSPLAPQDSILATITFTPSPGVLAFKVGGNGNTIVVWPYAIGAIIKDSLRTTLWVKDLSTSLLQNKADDQLKLFPNPILDKLNIQYLKDENYKQIIIYDIYGRRVKEIDFAEIIDVSDLRSGSYWMIISSEKKTYRRLLMKD